MQGVIRNVDGIRKDRGTVKADGGNVYHFYNQPGFMFEDRTSFTVDENGYAVGMKLIQKAGSENRTEYRLNAINSS